VANAAAFNKFELVYNSNMLSSGIRGINLPRVFREKERSPLLLLLLVVPLIGTD
jgi:hypothetical protein